eukprot:2704015-Alexandrium_andersonii.AAC.1
MSASLVGSEMCIRDRDSAAILNYQKPFLKAPLLLNLDSFEIQLGVQPVSYTHLTLPTICSV